MAVYRSNCKINIGLNVLRKRPDGYHDIESLFYPVYGLYDEISVVPRSDGDLVFTQEGIVVDCLCEDNLCVRAYELLRRRCGIGGADILIRKNIPFGAGLGGGSSNASFVLKATNEAYGLGLPEETLLRMAAELGSDTAFFVRNRPCFAEGRGELLSDAGISLDGYFLTLAKPSFSVSTREAYGGVVPSLPEHPLREIVRREVREWKKYLKNDFEPHLFAKYPRLAAVKRELYDRGALFALMSGSGSTLYAVSERPLDLSGMDGDLFFHEEKARLPDE